jgi:hypothetical protein
MREKGRMILFALFLTAISSAANATCLSLQRNGSSTFWINNCSTTVNVNWTDQGVCSRWSCSDSIGPRGRSIASIKGSVSWCECQGTGCEAKGPC